MSSYTALEEQVYKALNRLAKWRTVFAGWQLGTRPKGDPECDAVVDQRELLIILRAELSALTGALVKKGVITATEYNQSLLEETERLDAAYEEKFKGACSEDYGIKIYNIEQWIKTTEGWKP